MGDKFGSIVFYSFYIFERNYHELKSTIQGYKNLIASDDFISDRQKYMELHIYGGRELSRLIHNYATAWSSLRDSTRAIQRKLEKSEEEEIRKFVIEYEDKLNESLKDSFENLFVRDLRNYVQHKAVPVPNLHWTMIRNLSSSDTPLMDTDCSFEFSTREIQDFNRWCDSSKEYMKNNESIPVEKIIDRHFDMMKEFYLWINFRDDQLNPYASSEMKQFTFEQWKQKQNSM
ncbi:hypothetical protein ACSQ6I_20025 [Anabaena sp. WFMT]|uniref:hypothetical protein n=1 Tax=Anabaena sp. WFMT TaxID=3449730 RepID=UPI003F207E08